MKKNNKGFMLAEVIVVSVIVITTLVSLYGSYNNLYKLYTRRSRYYDIDGIYALNSVVRNLINDNDLNNILSDASIFGDTSVNNYYFLIESNACNEKASSNLCESVLKLYNVKNMVITKYNNIYYKDETGTETFLGKEDLELNETFKDYLKYINNNYQSGGYEDSYLLLIEYGEYDNNSNENLYYSNIILR